MTNDERENGRRIWHRLDELDDGQLQSLVAAATTVLADVSDDPAAQDYTTMPARVAQAEISQSLQEAGLRVNEAGVSRLTEDSASSRRVAIALLRALSAQPALAAEIEAAHQARGGMMAIDPMTVSAMVLLLFVLKLKGIKAGQLEVTFFEAKEGLIKTLRALVGG